MRFEDMLQSTATKLDGLLRTVKYFYLNTSMQREFFLAKIKIAFHFLSFQYFAFSNTLITKLVGVVDFLSTHQLVLRKSLSSKIIAMAHYFTLQYSFQRKFLMEKLATVARLSGFRSSIQRDTLIMKSNAIAEFLRSQYSIRRDSLAIRFTAVANLLDFQSITFWDSVAILIGSILAYLVALGLYNIYLHPLSRFPGPKLWVAYQAPSLYTLVTGRLPHRVKDFHDKYGSIVRTAPNQLSFTNPQAWRDVYANRGTGKKEFSKHMLWNLIPQLDKPKNEPLTQTIIGSDEAHHSRFRKILSPAFSEKALKSQESLIQSSIDLLMRRLRETADSNPEHVVDLNRWFAYTTFDIIGDLAFGESFNCLRDSKFHPWVAMVCGNLKAMCWFIAVRHYPLVEFALLHMIPKSMVEQIRSMDVMTEEILSRRMASPTDRPDFITYIKGHNGDKGMTPKEIHENSKSLIVAGSETSSTALSGLVSFLLSHSECMRKLIEEVRGTFGAELEISAANIGRLSYLTAALQETIRIYPSVPDGLRRVVPDGGDFVCGEFIPEGTAVAMNILGIHRSSVYFTRPMDFIPERWLRSQDSDLQSQPSGFEADNKSAFGGFSAGTRDCIGQNLAWMETRLIMARLLWNFDISWPKGSKYREQEEWTRQKTYLLWERFPLEVVLTPVKKL